MSAEKQTDPMEKLVDRVMKGETPLQVMARKGDTPSSQMRSIERFPYYTAFPFGWYRAFMSSELPVGGIEAVRYLGRDLIVWRGTDGSAHVMDAYCPHLGAHLGYGGRVEGCEIVCPFHWWQFDGDGNNTLVPYDGTRNRAAKLHSYPTIDRNGFILFWYHPTGEPPLWEIPKIEPFYDDGWTDYYPALWKVRSPWQEMAENGADYIHLRTVHGSVDIPELELVEYDGYFSKLRSRVNFKTPRGPQPGRIDSDGWGPGFSVARFSGIIDACFVSAQTPIDFEYTEVSFNYMIRKIGNSDKDLARTKRVGEAMIADLKRQEAEDIVIFENKIYQPTPRLSAADGPIAEFRRWAAQFYVEGDPRALNT